MFIFVSAHAKLFWLLFDSILLICISFYFSGILVIGMHQANGMLLRQKRWACGEIQ